MPAKSRRNRGKTPPPPSKRAKAGVSKQSAVTPESAETQSVAPVSTQAAVPVAAPVKSIKTRPAVEEVVHTYSYIKPELWTIGILAVIMLAILGILGVVL